MFGADKQIKATYPRPQDLCPMHSAPPLHPPWAPISRPVAPATPQPIHLYAAPAGNSRTYLSRRRVRACQYHYDSHSAVLLATNIPSSNSPQPSAFAATLLPPTAPRRSLPDSPHTPTAIRPLPSCRPRPHTPTTKRNHPLLKYRIPFSTQCLSRILTNKQVRLWPSRDPIEEEGGESTCMGLWGMMG